MNKSFDRYAWNARILPSLITLLPIALVGLSWLPAIEDAMKPALSLIVGAGTLFLLAQVSRDLGKEAERKLIAAWGGLPTTIMLRHRDTTIEPITKARYHKKLSVLMDGLEMPTEQSESVDPSNADSLYSSCVRCLLSKTRDQEHFPLLFTENVNYGFRRNLFGLKTLGTLISTVSGTGIAWRILSQHLSGQPISPLALGCLLFTVALLFLWLLFVNARLVRSGADAYAVRLLETVEQLSI